MTSESERTRTGNALFRHDRRRPRRRWRARKRRRARRRTFLARERGDVGVDPDAARALMDDAPGTVTVVNAVSRVPTPVATVRVDVAETSRRSRRRRVERRAASRRRAADADSVRVEGLRTSASRAGPAHRAGERAHAVSRVRRLDHHRGDVVQRDRARALGRGVRASSRGGAPVGGGRVGARMRRVARARRGDRRPVVELAVRRVRGRRPSRVAAHHARRRREAEAAPRGEAVEAPRRRTRRNVGTTRSFRWERLRTFEVGLRPSTSTDACRPEFRRRRRRFHAAAQI